MRMVEIQQKAKELGIRKPRVFRKADLIREIQRTEGNQPCFQQMGEYCLESTCCWRKDCVPPH